MADENSPSSKSHTSHQEASSNHANHSSKLYTHFPYKVAFVTVFLVLLPLFPCEIINQSENSRSWELIQLIFVGIAVSYGLFSKKNDEVEKDQGLKHETYVSKLLQVSSVFDDESENLTTVIDENKVQTWSSQYYREEPVVVVAKQNSNVNKDSRKPLLLPVRSLKQRVTDPNETDYVNDSGSKSKINRSSSKSSSKRFNTNLSITKNRDVGGKSSEKVEEKTEDNVVLRSPIPWRSRSGRLEIEENVDSDEFRLDTRSFRPNPSPKSLSPSQSLSSPKKLPNSAPFSMESQSKINEDVVRKKKFPSTPPPPPPPPPFPSTYLKKPNSSIVKKSPVSSEKEFRRSVRSMPSEEVSDSETDKLSRRTSPGSESKGRIINDGLAKSVRKSPVSSENEFRRSVRRMPSEELSDSDTDKLPKRTSPASESRGRTIKDGMAKSVRTFRSGEPLVEAESKSNNHDFKLPKEEKNDFFEKVLVETTDDDDSDDEAGKDNFVGSSGGGEEAVNGDNGNDPGPDVDKKADEFIAKFREQIRLQRINSFRRSTADRVKT